MFEVVRSMMRLSRPRRGTVSRAAKPTIPTPSTLSCLVLLVALASSSAVIAADVSAATPTDFQIPAASLADALSRFGSQSGMQVVYAPELARGLKSRALTGRLTVDAALNWLLEGTGLTWTYVNGNTVVLKRADAKKVPASNSRAVEPDTAVATEEITVIGKIPEVLVYGSRSLNADIQRTEDDVQPYVVFDMETIEQSGAISMEDFLKKRLPMNSVSGTTNQGPDSRGNASQINLRGLGTDQTLVLINGRRTLGGNANVGGSIPQFDLNGIPLAAVERIEVLPTTASGIYGGSATGGVVNVILRHDYTGAQAAVTYDNSFSSESAIRRVDFSAGLAPESGKTSLLVAAAFSDGNDLLVQDRHFVQTGRATVELNNPGFFPSAANPPVGASTNFRSVSGAPLFGPGSANFGSVPVGYAGGAGLAGLAPGAGRYNLDLASSAQNSGGALQGLLSESRNESLIATVRHELGSRLQVFADAGLANSTAHFARSLMTRSYIVSATAPNNPFGQAIRVTVPTAVGDTSPTAANFTRRAVVGGIVRLPAEWRSELDLSYSTFRSAFVQTGYAAGGTEATVIGDGTIDVLRDLEQFSVDLTPFLRAPLSQSPFRSNTRGAALRVAGPIGTLLAGKPKLSFLLEHRRDRFEQATQGTFVFPEMSQAVSSAYAETTLPLLTSRRLGEVELLAAARWDRYDVEGATGFVSSTALDSIVRTSNRSDTVSPTFGIRWKPWPSLIARASYGKGFLPPNVLQLTPAAPFLNTTSVFIDPRRNNEPVSGVTTRSGGSPDVTPERSESWSAGLVFGPAGMQNLRVSLDYTRIEKYDNISEVTPQQIIDNEVLFPTRVGRGPVAPGDPFGVGEITSVDFTAVNISEALVEAFDLSFDYELNIGASTVAFSLAGTKQTHYRTQLVPQAPVVENVGVTRNNPLKLKGNAAVTWNAGPWTLGWNAQYFDSYLVADPALTSSAPTIANQGGVRVNSQTYHDAFAQYAFGERTQVSGGVRNVFDHKPPFDAGETRYYYSLYGDPRGSSYYVSLKHSF